MMNDGNDRNGKPGLDLAIYQEKRGVVEFIFEQDIEFQSFYPVNKRPGKIVSQARRVTAPGQRDLCNLMSLTA